MWKNSTNRYGLVARWLHWAMVPLLLGLLAMGLWLTRMDYNDPWYQTASRWHEGVGVLAFVLFVLRLLWRLWDPPPPDPFPRPLWQTRLARGVHRLLYLLMALVPLSGYLFVTAKGGPVTLFGGLTIPALFGKLPAMEKMIGQLHLLLALALLGLVALHLLATLKHQLLDKEDILSRIFAR
ncbi:MAG: cytochrome b/b6 domain-containing protein [Magnetococcus sp. MYC-9]